MNNDQDIIDLLAMRWPHLFEKSVINDVDIGPGWYNIVDVLCGEICSELDRLIEGQMYYTRLSAETKIPEFKARYAASAELFEKRIPDAIRALPVITCMKRMSGGLIINYQDRCPAHDGATLYARKIADRTCEICGAPGKASYLAFTFGGAQVLCKAHFQPPTSISDSADW